jgi:hypothetical protein
MLMIGQTKSRQKCNFLNRLKRLTDDQSLSRLVKGAIFAAIGPEGGDMSLPLHSTQSTSQEAGKLHLLDTGTAKIFFRVSCWDLCRKREEVPRVADLQSHFDARLCARLWS